METSAGTRRIIGGWGGSVKRWEVTRFSNWRVSDFAFWFRGCSGRQGSLPGRNRDYVMKLRSILVAKVRV